MKETLETIRREALSALEQTKAAQDLEALRVKYLGKKGELTAVLKQMGRLSAEERPIMGQLANEVRETLTDALARRQQAIAEAALNAKLEAEALDVTIPGKRPELGHKHPMSIALDELKDIFVGMGFQVAEGPEVELAEYNFTKLNTEEGHPAREWGDTFYIKEDSSLLLRTQTSPMQVRTMEKMAPPIRIIAPGRVYRKDEVDATHSPFVEALYGKGTKTRFRPHHFPFTEPSCEVDVQCHACGGAGCRVCKGEGWIELLGAGMVHPKVLQGVGIDTDVYSGFAFGIGVERMAMRRFGITDLRLIFENDMRFLSQF